MRHAEGTADERVEVWSIELDREPHEVDQLALLLDARELTDACARVRPADRGRLIVARAARRQLLARYLDVDPVEVTYLVDRWGRPELDPRHGSDLRFSSARSGHRAMVATTEARSVGIDLEQLRPVPEAMAIASAWFDPTTCRQLVTGPSVGDDLAFLSRWTALEATLKAVGRGLAAGGHDVRLAHVAAGIVRVREPDGHGCWETWPLTAAGDGDVVAAVVTEPPRGPVAWQRWTEPHATGRPHAPVASRSAHALRTALPPPSLLK
jgi:4'-phosphopantetheinyl transferase